MTDDDTADGGSGFILDSCPRGTSSSSEEDILRSSRREVEAVDVHREGEGQQQLGPGKTWLHDLGIVGSTQLKLHRLHPNKHNYRRTQAHCLETNLTNYIINFKQNTQG